MELDNPHPAPENWEETYNQIKEMRKKTVAPVDTMGCAQAQLREIDPKVTPQRHFIYFSVETEMYRMH